MKFISAVKFPQLLLFQLWIVVFVPGFDEVKSLDWLKYNREPWSEVEKHWVLTYKYRADELKRSSELQEYISTYKVLTQSLGYTLIQSDFKNIFPDKVDSLFSNWGEFRSKILRILKEAKKDPYILKLKEMLNDEPGEVSGIDDVMVELRAPRFIVHRHSAVLRCEHNVDPETLYKVVFFKNDQRFMKFVQGRDPPYELFNLTGAEINLSKLSPTSVTLQKMDFSASGTYACEIALETPLYSKLSKPHELIVIVRQKYRPKIKIRYNKLMANADLEATCQSAPAHPAPHLSWFINNEKVDERLTIPHGTMNVPSRVHPGLMLSVTNSSLQFPLSMLSLQPNQTVDVTCLATIPSYASFGEGFADIQNHTVVVNVVQSEPTTTQQIISLPMNTAHRFNIQHLIMALPFLEYFHMTADNRI